MIQISKRLSAIAALVTRGNRLADIGCDHGYLPIYLVQQSYIPGAIAMDVRRGPLSRAREHIQAYGLLDYIECRLSDGLEALEPGEAQTIVIAGMGGTLMEGILSRGAEKLAAVCEVILQPQSNVEHFRRFLGELSFTVVGEDMVEEEGKYYPIMRLVPGTPEEGWQEAEYRYGKYLLEAGHPVLKDYLCRERARLERLEADLQAAGTCQAGKRWLQVRRERECLEEAWKKYGFIM